ncbi:MAG: AAA family ATPase [Deltaproteobacteria bacterium]|nr:AAA family ATPase [Deltaproteobacteria bacterium]
MKIEFIELENFRRLKSVRIDFAEKTTVFIGANNSGKTTAIEAVKKFLALKSSFQVNDFTLSLFSEINQIGLEWETIEEPPKDWMAPWTKLLPKMDVWLDVDSAESFRVQHLLPTLGWDGGRLGFRLQLELSEPIKLFSEYKKNRLKNKAILEIAKKSDPTIEVDLHPANLIEFLEKHIKTSFKLRAYLLDTSKLNIDSEVSLQDLDESQVSMPANLVKQLFKVDFVPGQRNLNDTDGFDEQGAGKRQVLSQTLQNFMNVHSGDETELSPEDVKVKAAIRIAESSLDQRWNYEYQPKLQQIKQFGYPGLTDYEMSLSAKFESKDGLNHDAALQYRTTTGTTSNSSERDTLPEHYNGLGYQNLIFITLELMRFRDSWLHPKSSDVVDPEEKDVIQPIHLVLIEEPEAHLHVQVQQVFINQAYDLLRSHEDLEDNIENHTQLIVSTHSSHIINELPFSVLRYFRRNPLVAEQLATSKVVNLTQVFGDEDESKRFVSRYLKLTHCDLFFADAAILIEGSAERMLVPEFIKSAKLDRLIKSYYTLLEINGAHAHRFKELIDLLGIPILIITDLDPKERNSNKSALPELRQGQTTRNEAIKTWVDKKGLIDDLMKLKEPDKAVKSGAAQVRLAYQTLVEINYADEKESVIPYTFEDALFFENISFFEGAEGLGLIKKFNKACTEEKTVVDLIETIRNAVKGSTKANFALDLLYHDKQSELKVPSYILLGLRWLQDQLVYKQEKIPTEKTEQEGA